jgi:hypothetical protein
MARTMFVELAGLADGSWPGTHQAQLARPGLAWPADTRPNRVFSASWNLS